MPVDVLKAGSLSSVTVAEMSDVGSGGEGITDAPDDKQYLRTKGAWGLIGDWAKTGVPGNQTQVDWNAETGVGSIKNKPTIPPDYTLPAATAAALGGVKMAAKVESTGSVADIIKALQDAGIMSK